MKKTRSAYKAGPRDCMYKVILADPPWHFRNWSEDAPGKIHPTSGGAARHYPTMTTDALCRLSVPAADDAVLFLWACWPLLPDAMRVIEAWGFTYKTLAWEWVKLNPSSIGFHMGMGYYTRANTEPCLLATRGKPTKPLARDVMALIVSPLQEHSRKPEVQYEKIERLYPEGPYLEMFARRNRSDWHVWGNQVESNLEIESK